MASLKENRPGRPYSAVTPENVAQQLIEGDKRRTYEEIKTSTIIHEHLHLKNIASRRVPHCLTKLQKAERVRIYRETHPFCVRIT